MSTVILVTCIIGLLGYAAAKGRYLKNDANLIEAYACRSGLCGNIKVVDSKDNKEAAEQLIDIYRKLLPVYDVMRKKPGFIDKGPLRLSDILESDGFSTADNRTTYLHDKTSMHVCLRDANGLLYAKNSSDKLNRIMYVVLHEITHRLTRSWDHTPEFWENFALVLKEAQRQRSYSPEDFSTSPWVHCGKKSVNHGGI